MKPKLLSLFAGIGGFDLGFERAGFEVAGHVEIDKWCRQVLQEKWPNALCLEDVREVHSKEYLDNAVRTWYVPLDGKGYSVFEKPIVEELKKLTAEQSCECVKLYDAGIPVQYLADYFCVSTTAMADLLCRKTTMRPQEELPTDFCFQDGEGDQEFQAKNMVVYAIKNGILQISHCEGCEENGCSGEDQRPPQPYHDDYNKPLDVRWLCPACRLSRRITNPPKRRTTLREVNIKIDIITFGFPCQDLSVAGKRKGLEGERSGLFYEALRIIDELKPTWAIWENVPGLLSSDGGRDLARVMFSMVEHGYSGCYRVLDSQWFGVAQRRRRLFGVFTRGHSGAERAAKVLSVGRALHKPPAPERTPREGFAPDLAPCLAASGRGVERVGETRGQDPVVAFQGQASVTQGFSMCSETSSTLDKSKTPYIAFDMSHADDPVRLTGDKTNTLQSRMGTGGNQVPCIAINDVIHGDKQCNGKGWNDSGVAYTLDTRATQGVCAPVVMAHGQGNAEIAEGVCPTLNCNHEQPIYFEPRFVRNGSGVPTIGGAAPTLLSGDRGDGAPHVAGERWGVRRLTPTECERLQGFQDGWTASLSDAQRYKALGNAVTVNVAEWIAKRLIKEIQNDDMCGNS